MRATYLNFISRWWLTLVMAAIVAGASGYVIAGRLPATYEAESRALVGPISAEREVVAASSSLVRTFAELASSRPVQQAALESAGSSRSVEDFAENVQVRADAETRILSIRVRDASPDAAANLANAMTEALQAFDTTIPRLPEGRLTIVQVAVPPTERFGPSSAQVAVLAALAGFIAAVLLVIAVDYLSDYVSRPEDLPAGVKLLGVVPDRRRALRASKVPVRDAPDSDAALLYQLVARRVGGSGQSGVPIFVVAGVGRGEGAGEVVANLALAMRRNGLRVRMLDVDGERHVADGTLGGHPRAGRHDLVQYDMTRKATRRSVRNGGLSVDTWMSGHTSDRAFARVRADTDLVLVSPPALSTSASALMWAQNADGLILVVQAEQTGRRRLEEAIRSSTRVGATLMGVLLREHVRQRRADAGGERRVPPTREDSPSRDNPGTIGERSADPTE